MSGVGLESGARIGRGLGQSLGEVWGEAWGKGFRVCLRPLVEVCLFMFAFFACLCVWWVGFGVGEWWVFG